MCTHKGYIRYQVRTEDHADEPKKKKQKQKTKAKSSVPLSGYKLLVALEWEEDQRKRAWMEWTLQRLLTYARRTDHCTKKMVLEMRDELQASHPLDEFKASQSKNAMVCIDDAMPDDDKDF